MLAAGAVWFILESPPWLEKSVKIVAGIKGVKFEQLTVKDAGFTSDGSYRIDEMTAAFYVPKENKQYTLGVKKINLQKRPKDLLVTVTGLKLKDKMQDIEIQNLDLNASAELFRFEYLQGTLKVLKVQYGEYQVKNIISNIEGQKNSFLFDQFKADFYGGNLRGNFSFVYAPQPAYHINIELKEVDALLLRKAQPAFENIRGRISGPLVIDGNLNEITSLQGALKTVKGAEIKAFLLQPILQYVPVSKQKQQLEKVIAIDGLVPLQTAEIYLDSLERNKLSSRLKLKSKEYNLDLNISLDLNVDGGLMRLLTVNKDIF